MRKLYVVTSLLAVAGIVFGGYQQLHASPVDTQLNTTTVAAKKTLATSLPTTSRTIDSTTLTAQINALIAQYGDMDVSVALTDLSSGASYTYGDDSSYYAASVTKLVTASLYLHDVEQGTRSLNDAIDGQSANDLLQALIINSDNDAWESLNANLGDSQLEAYATSMGMTSYDVNTNTVSTADIAQLLTKLYKQQLLNTDDTQLLLSYMKQANYADYIPAAAGDGVTVYHKAGVLDDRFNDAAILDDGQHAYVLVIFSKTAGDYDSTSGMALFHAITTETNKIILGKESDS